MLLEYYDSPQQFSRRNPKWGREEIVRIADMTRIAALKLRGRVEYMKRDISKSKVRDL